LCAKTQKAYGTVIFSVYLLYFKVMEKHA